MTPFALGLDTQPMEARLAADLPGGSGWQFEPKWDGFRCLAFKAGGAVELRAKSGKPLGRYFPEMTAALQAAPADGFVLDGELVVPRGAALSFAAVQDRVHPAESRIRRLAAETPALLVLFDCLATAEGSLLAAPLSARRAALEAAVARIGPAHRVRLSPYTLDAEAARRWLSNRTGALDGVVAKRLDGAYEPGKRAMLKVKRARTADCVVGGYRTLKDTDQVGSLLLGLYDAAGRLDHVGFTSAITAAERPGLTARLAPLRGGDGFTGDAPGGPSRWSTERSAAWVPLRPELVVEVSYDQVTDGRFRHGTALVRWRPDKAAWQCTRDQLAAEQMPGRVIQDALGGTSAGG